MIAMNIFSSPFHCLMLGNIDVEDDDGNVVDDDAGDVEDVEDGDGNVDDDDGEKDEPVCPLQSQWPQWYFAGLTSYFSKVSSPSPHPPDKSAS